MNHNDTMRIEWSVIAGEALGEDNDAGYRIAMTQVAKYTARSAAQREATIVQIWNSVALGTLSQGMDWRTRDAATLADAYRNMVRANNR